jgi:hypothetical protein
MMFLIQNERIVMKHCLCPSAWRFVLLLFGLCAAHSASAAGYTLSINVDGSGSVSRNPTNSIYPDGAVVTITAIPNAGWFFSSWSGDAGGASNPLNVAMNSNKVITAHFQLIPSFTLTVATSGQGSAALDPPGGTYLSNSIVSVTATPNAGWVFVQWTGDASGNANPLSVNLNASKSVTAVFAELPAIDNQPQNVSVDIGGTASFSVHATGTAPLTYQWHFSGSPLPGPQAAMLTLTNVQPTQAGEYWVVVANAYGSATSSRATLAVRDSCTGTNVVSTCTEAALRAAMSVGGLVRLCCNGTIVLSNTIDVTRDVALDARDRNVIISGNNAVRLFTVSPGVKFSITNLVLANGRHMGSFGGFPGEGGAIFNNGGIVEIASSRLTNNQAIGGANQGFSGSAGEGRGGAIFTRGGTLRLHNSEITHSIAQGGSTDFQSTIPSGDASGGAIYTTNSLVELVECIARSNACLAPSSRMQMAKASGGALLLASGSVLISNSVVAGNSALGSFAGQARVAGLAYGGAVAAISGTLVISDSVVISNIASGGGGRQAIPSGEAQGGAVYSKATVTAINTVFSRNQVQAGAIGYPRSSSGQGGAIHNSGSAVLNRCSLDSNLTRGGDGSEFFGLAAGPGLGGGIFNAGELRATNCTVALNSAIGGRGDLFGGINGNPATGLGGGVYAATGSVVLVNLTIASNSVAAGGPSTNASVGANVVNSNGTLTLRNSLLAYGGTNGNAWGIITDSGFNISSDGSANFNSGSSFNFTDPRLGPLADYGGPTPTMALRPNSPAIDFGGANGAPPIDQRGWPRPFGAGVDIGAYEFYSNQTELPRLGISSAPGAVTLYFQAFPATEYHLQACETLSSPWDKLETIGPFANSTSVIRTIQNPGNLSRFFRLKIP